MPEKATGGQPLGRRSDHVPVSSVVDPTVAPPRQHLTSMLIQYALSSLRGPLSRHERARSAARCCNLVNECAPNFKAAVIDRQVLTPVDLERTFTLTVGNIFQGAMALHQLFCFRLVPGFAGYHTP